MLIVANVLLILMSPAQSIAATNEDIQSVRNDWTFFSNKSYNTCAGQGGASLVGEDVPTQVWNFFRAKGLDDVHAAAVLGNLKQEAGFNPERIEGDKGLPATSPDPNAAGEWGWGIVQWTPGSKVLISAQKLKDMDKLSKDAAINDLLTQLIIVWNEMDGTLLTPTAYSGDFLTEFNATTNVVDATEFFRAKYESGTPGNRQQSAQEFLTQYGGTVAVAVSSTTGCASVSPNCASATGTTKIICEAQKYDPTSYSYGSGHNGAANWKSGCSNIDSSCYLDCSGLVNVAVYDAFGADINETTETQRNHAASGINWREISLEEVQPGDIVQPNSGHVEIVDHRSGNDIYTFGAHQPKENQAEEVGPSKWPYTSEFKFFRYIGQGA